MFWASIFPSTIPTDLWHQTPWGWSLWVWCFCCHSPFCSSFSSWLCFTTGKTHITYRHIGTWTINLLLYTYICTHTCMELDYLRWETLLFPITECTPSSMWYRTEAQRKTTKKKMRWVTACQPWFSLYIKCFLSKKLTAFLQRFKLWLLHCFYNGLLHCRRMKMRDWSWGIPLILPSLLTTYETVAKTLILLLLVSEFSVEINDFSYMK